MNISAIFEVTRKAYAPVLRKEVERYLCRTGMIYRFLKIKPETKENQKKIKAMLDKCTTEEIEFLYGAFFRQPEE